MKVKYINRPASFILLLHANANRSYCLLLSLSSLQLNNQILQKHAQLLEILEVPQLIDTCVKNGHFDEALELANYIRRLDKKHGSQIPLVSNGVCLIRVVSVRACICLSDPIWLTAPLPHLLLLRPYSIRPSLFQVRTILVEVRNCIQSMVGQLISQLRTAQLTLPVCLKVIGHIRRLDAFSETELRVLFLNARDSWFQSTLARYKYIQI